MRRCIRRFLRLAAVLTPCAGAAQTPTTPAPGGPAPVPQAASSQMPAVANTAASVAHGKSVFIANGCAACHGTSAEGGVGPHLAPNPLPAAAIAAYIRHPTGEMPPYAPNTVSDADIADIATYLQTIPPRPKASSIPELNQ